MRYIGKDTINFVILFVCFVGSSMSVFVLDTKSARSKRLVSDTKTVMKLYVGMDHTSRSINVLVQNIMEEKK